MCFKFSFGFKNSALFVLLALLCAVLSTTAEATTLNSGGMTGGDVFEPFYDFIYAAGTGYLGRAICLVGGLIGLGLAAFTGKMMIAMLPAALALFGVFGPVIVNAFFSSAFI